MTMAGLHFYDFYPSLSDFQAEILAGLSSRQKYIAPKFFYDAEGSQLFDRICELPEYYLTRTEIGLLERYGTQIADAVGPDAVLFELGSGSSRKIRLLLDALRPVCYVPIDISRPHLRTAANALAAEYPWLDIHAVCADYAGALRLPSGLEGQRRIVFFPGSSIGNLTPEEASALLKRMARLVGDGGGLLIGVDLVKRTDVLEAAYNDRQKVTEAFNKNLLVRINRELDADFRIDRFDHLAFYNPGPERIEMYLASSDAQSVRIADRTIRMAAGETIHTENSHKYTLAGFRRLALRTGFRPGKVWIDPEGLFSIHYLSA
jgi:dimethylhistidine N-methyltransferase